MCRLFPTRKFREGNSLEWLNNASPSTVFENLKMDGPLHSDMKISGIARRAPEEAMAHTARKASAQQHAVH